MCFVELRKNSNASENEIINFCKKNMASYKCPKSVIFREIPKTSTGKIQKFLLRKIAKKV